MEVSPGYSLDSVGLFLLKIKNESRTTVLQSVRQTADYTAAPMHTKEVLLNILSTVLVTLLISDTNSTAYPTLIYGLYLPYGPGVGL